MDRRNCGLLKLVVIQTTSVGLAFLPISVKKKTTSPGDNLLHMTDNHRIFLSMSDNTLTLFGNTFLSYIKTCGVPYGTV